MKLGKLILTAMMGLCATHVFGNWQPYIGIGVQTLEGNYSDAINNPFIFPDSASGGNYTTNSGAPYTLNGSMMRGIIPTLQLGIANQYNKFYLGFEADGYYNNSTYTTNSITETDHSIIGPPSTLEFSNTGSGQILWNFNLTTQLGYFITPKLMPYLRAGVASAYANTNFTYTDLPGAGNSNPIPVFTANSHVWLWGPIVGVGAQYSLTQHVRSFAEVDYTSLTGNTTPNATILYPIDVPRVTPFKQNISFSSWAAKVGLNYYF